MTKLKKIKTNQLVLPKTNNLPFKVFKPNNFVFTCKRLTLHTHKNNNNNNNKRILQKKIIIKENLCHLSIRTKSRNYRTQLIEDSPHLTPSPNSVSVFIENLLSATCETNKRI